MIHTDTDTDTVTITSLFAVAIVVIVFYMLNRTVYLTEWLTNYVDKLFHSEKINCVLCASV